MQFWEDGSSLIPSDYRAHIGSVSDVFGQAEVGCRVDERTVDLNPEVAVWAGGISRGAGADDQQVGFEFAVNHDFRALFQNYKKGPLSDLT